jgi:hypothetical protein
MAILCLLAFTLAYVATRAASGEAAPTDPEATPEVVATLESGSNPASTIEATATPDAGAVAPPEETVAPEEGPFPLDLMGNAAAEGSVFEKYGVRLQIPKGLGDFRVIYPVIVDWGVPEDTDLPNVIMTIYNPQTKSSLFLNVEGVAKGHAPIRLGEKIGRPEAQSPLDSIASSAEVTE